MVAIANPFSTLPLFVALTANSSVSEKMKVASVSIITFVITMLIFTYFGLVILDFFGISLAAFRIAGGLLMLLTALDMMRSDLAKPPSSTSASNSVRVGIAPIAIPSLSGPGAISTIIIFAGAHNSTEHIVLVTVDILITALIMYAILFSAIKMGGLLGETANLVMNRVLGLIVASIGIEFIIHGIAGHFPDMTILH